MRKGLLIMNPMSGKKNLKQIYPRLKEEFEKYPDISMDKVKTEYVGHASKIIMNTDMTQYDLVCSFGGDGTLHEIINGMMNREDRMKLPIGVIPNGSGNSLSRDLNILDISTAVKTIAENNKVLLDIAEVRTIDETSGIRFYVFSFNIVGWGMVTDIGIKAEKYRWLGTARYTILSLIQILFKRTQKAQLTYLNQDKTIININHKFIFIIACNTIHTGKGMKMAPKAILNDGLIDLIIVKDVSRIKLLSLMPKLFTGTHIFDKAAKYIQTSEFELIPEKYTELNIDGEIKSNTPIKVKIIPSAIEVFANEQ